MSPPHDIVQSVFLMSLAANGASELSATQTQLREHLNTFLSGGPDGSGNRYAGFFPKMNPRLHGGDWTVVWGPCVYSRNPSMPNEATNAMYVAYSAKLATYVVAIAATNPSSLYDWLVEDGDVSAVYQAKWPISIPFTAEWHLLPFLPGTAATSAATAIGISDLLSQPSMMDPNSGSLQRFLSQSVSEKATLIFCGHSLAGALSPALALHLYSNPSSSGWKQVLVLPTAGASPGNSSFAQVFAQAYPAASSGLGTPYDCWNVNYANIHDVVPHAWNQLDKIVQPMDASGNYPSIWGVFDPFLGKALTDALEAARLLALRGDYDNIPQTAFEPGWGTWVWTQNPDGSWQYPPLWKEMRRFTDTSPATSTDELGDLLLATHIDQYSNFFNVVPGPRMPSTSPVLQAARTKQRALSAAARLDTRAKLSPGREPLALKSVLPVSRSLPAERFRIISLDGGPSTPFILRILRFLEEENPGFIKKAAMFSGTSDGAFAGLYLANALSQGRSGIEAIEGCIQFHNTLVQSFELTPVAIMRMASGLFSMLDGTKLTKILEAHYKNARGYITTLGELTPDVSIASFDATLRHTETYSKLKSPQTTLVEAALAGSAFMPLFPAFRDRRRNAADQGDIMFDGAFSGNTPVLPAISDALHALKCSSPNDPLFNPSADAIDCLRQISLLSMGCNVQPSEILRWFYKLPWPLFRENKMLYQYGWLWNLLSNVHGLASTVIQGGSTDQLYMALQLLGQGRSYRFSPIDAGLYTLLRLMADPDAFLVGVDLKAWTFWDEGKGQALSHWVRNSWMNDTRGAADATSATPRRA